MTDLNSIEKNFNEDLKVSVDNPSKLFAGFFNGVIIQVDQLYK